MEDSLLPPSLEPASVAGNLRDERDVPAAAGPEAAAVLHAAQRFAAFAAHHGATVCGPALGEPRVEDGHPVQYFRNLVLELGSDGQIAPRPLGSMALARQEAAPTATELRFPQWLDLRAELPTHVTLRYPLRPLAQIRYLILHHSGASARFDARQIAAEHVGVNGWPGMGYHFVIGPDGLIEQCQDLGVSSHHVAQFNPVAVGIALLGDLRLGAPTGRQMDAAADLLSCLCQQLGLPRQAIRGHGEMVSTDCPGPAFLAEWRSRLFQMVGDRLRDPAVGPAGGQSG